MDGGHGGEGGRPLTPLQRLWDEDTPSGRSGDGSSPDSVPMEESSSLIIHQSSEAKPRVEYPVE